MSDTKKDLAKEKSPVPPAAADKPVLVQFSGPYKNYVAGDVTGVTQTAADQLVEKRLATLYTAE